jgi:hypothetical protein
MDVLASCRQRHRSLETNSGSIAPVKFGIKISTGAHRLGCHHCTDALAELAAIQQHETQRLSGLVSASRSIAGFEELIGSEAGVERDPSWGCGRTGASGYGVAGCSLSERA